MTFRETLKKHLLAVQQKEDQNTPIQKPLPAALG